MAMFGPRWARLGPSHPGLIKSGSAWCGPLVVVIVGLTAVGKSDMAMCLTQAATNRWSGTQGFEEVKGFFMDLKDVSGNFRFFIGKLNLLVFEGNVFLGR